MTPLCYYCWRNCRRHVTIDMAQLPCHNCPRHVSAHDGAIIAACPKQRAWWRLQYRPQRYIVAVSGVACWGRSDVAILQAWWHAGGAGQRHVTLSGNSWGPGLNVHSRWSSILFEGMACLPRCNELGSVSRTSANPKNIEVGLCPLSVKFSTGRFTLHVLHVRRI